MSDFVMPEALNGYPVKAFTILNDRAIVIVHREDETNLPWVGATWWPELGTNWSWGNYFASWEEADAWRREKCATHRANFGG